MSDHSKVLDLARKCSDGTDQVFEEDGKLDEVEDREWHELLAQAQEYHGEYRYANKTPQELRRLLETETNQDERDALEWTLMAFQAKGWAAGDPDDPKATKAGEPYRGETKVAITSESISVLAKDRNPVKYVESVGQMGQGIPERLKSGEGLGMVQGPGGIWEEE